MTGVRQDVLRRPSPPRDPVGRVSDGEYARLLGYPDRRIPEGRASERARQARGRARRLSGAYALARRIRIVRIRGPEVELANGESFSSARLASRLRRAGAEHLFVTAVGAGREVDGRCQELWRQSRPDEAYFLDRLAAAVCEFLAIWLADFLAAEVLAADRGLVAAYSPGHEGWDLGQQVGLSRALIDGDPGNDLFEVSDSGMITPKSSLLAVHAVSRWPATSRRSRAADCVGCALAACGFRRPRLRSPVRP